MTKQFLTNNSKKDYQMSEWMLPKERYRKTLKGEKPDKLPLFVGNYNNFLFNFYNIGVDEFLGSPEAAAEVTVKFTKEFNFDCNMVVGVGYIFYGCGPELGVKWGFPEKQVPGPIGGFIKTKEDIDHFQIPSAPSGYFKKFLDIIRKVNQEIGEKIHLQAPILGPFSIACFVRGLKDTLLDMYDRPALFNSYMPLCVELSKYFGIHIFATGIESPSLTEIFLVPEMVNPEHYHKNIRPYIQQVIDFFGNRLLNPFGAFMGKPGDKKSQEEGRYVWDAFWGTKESLEALEKGIKYKAPGYPIFLTLSGRALYFWSEVELLDFVRQGTDLVVKNYHAYPAISLISIQPDSREDAQKMAHKLRRIDEFRNGYLL